MIEAGEGGEPIRFERRGGLAVIVLDRPKALNALTHPMVRAMSRRLASWRDDPEVAAVLVKAVPGRAFCAGGDILAATRRVRDHGADDALTFFRDEYRLNWRIKQFPKPYIALVDGIVMGGGVGISVHGSHRVLTEATMFAMPETGIGFFPDVGGSFFLPRLPGAVGTWLGLTGAKLGPADGLAAGIGTHLVPRDRLDGLEEALAGAGDAAAIDAALARFQGAPDGGELLGTRSMIDDAFAGGSIGEIVRALERQGTPFAADQRTTLETRSPFSLHASLALLRRGRRLEFAECMRLEYRTARHFLEAQDFAEGVRALLVDKDKRPRWRHDRLEAVPAAEVEALFTPIAGGDLALDWDEA